jgi:hypothetical protein
MNLDPGDLGAGDQLANLRAVREGTRVFSAYRLRDDTRTWIITEADRSATPSCFQRSTDCDGPTQTSTTSHSAAGRAGGSWRTICGDGERARSVRRYAFNDVERCLAGRCTRDVVLVRAVRVCATSSRSQSSGSHAPKALRSQPPALRPRSARCTTSFSAQTVGFGAKASADRFPFGFRARLILATRAGTSTAAMMSADSGGRTSRAAAAHCWRCCCSRTSASGTRQRKFSWGLTSTCPAYLYRSGSVARSTATWSYNPRRSDGQASVQPAAPATCTYATPS